MAASVQYRQQERSLGMVMGEKDDDHLAMFLKMRDLEKDRNDSLFLQNLDEFDEDALGGPEPYCSSITSTIPSHKPGGDDFLNPESEKTDYDWLLTPPGTPLFPSLDMDSGKTVTSQEGIFNTRPAAVKSRLANPPAEPVSRCDVKSRRPTTSAGINSSTAGIRRPSPAARPTLPATAKSSRSSTPTSRATLSSTKPLAHPKRSSTPTASTARSSTPTSLSKSAPRSATPTRSTTTPSSVPSTSAPASRSSSVPKSGATSLKKTLPSRGTSPPVKSRPLKSSEMLSGPKTSLPKRPASASRGRPREPNARTSSTEICSNGKTRRQSASPARGHAPNRNGSGSKISVLSRSRGLPNDDVNPVLMGTMMVERVVNMRKLAPPKQDDDISNSNYPSGKSSSSQDKGFGRSLSKKSLDMALRHMDIRRSVPGNLRPLMTNVPASSIYSVRSGSTKNRSGSVSDSPLATSSNSSFERSMSNNSHCLDGSELEDSDVRSETAQSSPSSQRGR